MRFDPTVDLGSLIATAAFLIAGLSGYLKIQARLSVLEARVGDLWTDFIHRRHEVKT